MPLKARSTTGRVWPEQVSGVCLIAMAARTGRAGRGAEGRLVLLSPPQRLRLRKAPALTPGNRQRRPIRQPRGQERVRDGAGSQRPAPDRLRGREREGGRRAGEGENQRTRCRDPHRPHRHRPEVTFYDAQRPPEVTSRREGGRAWQQGRQWDSSAQARVPAHVGPVMLAVRRLGAAAWGRSRLFGAVLAVILAKLISSAQTLYLAGPVGDAPSNATGTVVGI